MSEYAAYVIIHVPTVEAAHRDGGDNWTAAVELNGTDTVLFKLAPVLPHSSGCDVNVTVCAPPASVFWTRTTVIAVGDTGMRSPAPLFEAAVNVTAFPV